MSARRSPLALTAIATVAVVAGCTPGGDDAPSPTPTAPTEATAASPAPSPQVGAVTLDATCTLEPDEEGLPAITLRYPSAWEVTDEDAGPCRFFDPEDPSIEGGTENPGVDVRAYVDPVEFERASEPDQTLEDSERRTTEVDGRSALRIEGTTTGRGLGPASIQRTTWIIDVSDGDQPGILVITADETGTSDYERAAGVADAMASSADIG